METKSTTAEAVKQHSMEETQIAHLAGAFDMAGLLNVYVNKDEEYAIGYNMNLTCRMSFGSNQQNPIMGKLKSYCEEENIPYSVQEFSPKKDKTVYRVVIQKPYAIEEFLLPMLDHLVNHYESAIILLEQIIPRIKDGLHKEKQGFYEIMEFADVLRQKTTHESRIKYDQEHFAEEWSLRPANCPR